jgi:heme-degrading monooxygenase HmoA
MTAKGIDMFNVMYHWKVKEGCEENFRNAWRRATEAIYQKYNSLGSRLHKSDDGRWIAYAQWRSREDWQAMQNSSEACDEEAFAMMRDSIEGTTEVTCLTLTDDLFK